ncbi:TraE/TraK family type IV conjugative transfer system protein [Burkholderia multivorans]|nr:TraE/TraK family type IV conjugative transfer system protein [Burkholderia multivorans]
MKLKSSYPDVIVNAFKSVQAWKSLSMVLIGVFIFETIALVWLASHQTALLIPQHLPSDKGPIKVDLGSPFSPDYLTAVAKGDAYSLLNWTPDSIDAQYGLFMSRLTPALYDAQKEVLLAESKQHSEEGLTQSFYVTRSFVKGNEVTLRGILVRSSGGREIYRGPAAYALTYVDAGGGVLLVSGVRQPSDTEAHATESAALIGAHNAEVAAQQAAAAAAAAASQSSAQ